MQQSVCICLPASSGEPWMALDELEPMRRVLCHLRVEQPRHKSSASSRQHQLLEVMVSRGLRHNCSASNSTRRIISKNTAMSSMASFSGNGRGGFAPRRGRGRGGRVPHFSKPREQVKPDINKHPLGKLVKTFSILDLKVGSGQALPDTEISDCQYVASYNWLNSQNPTIVVPGEFFFTYKHPPHELKYLRKASTVDSPTNTTTLG